MPNLLLFDSAQLLLLIEQDSQEAFKILYERYWQNTYNKAYKRLKDTTAAKDIVQELFTHIWLKRHCLHIDNIEAYLQVAVRNKVFKTIQKQKKTHSFFAAIGSLSSFGCPADAGIKEKEFLQAYDVLLKKLPPKRQHIFRLRFEQDLPAKEIASRLNLSRKTVQNQLGVALEQLRLSLINLLTILLLYIPVVQ